MATIYRFIVEQKQSVDNTGKAKKGAGKKGSKLPMFDSGYRGGVEHNRKLRAINPVMNKITNGIWEKGMRLGRAATGLIKTDPNTGKLVGISGPALAIIIAFILITTWNILNRNNQKARASAEKANTSDFKRLENGTSAIHGAYKVSADMWSGRITYNENK